MYLRELEKIERNLGRLGLVSSAGAKRAASVAGPRTLKAWAPGLALAAALLLSPSCKKGTDAPTPAHGGALRATVEGHAGDSKTHLGGDGGLHVLWDANDAIDVRYAVNGGSYSQQYYKFTTTDNIEIANFDTNDNLPVDFYVAGASYEAYYPSASDGGWNELRGMAGNKMRLPRTQHYNHENPSGFGVGDNPMHGVSMAGDQYTIGFKNMCGVLRLRLTGSGTVKRLIVTSKGGELLWGEGAVTEVDGNSVIESKSLTKGTSSVELDCGPGVELTGEPKCFSVVLPVGALKMGFTVQAFDSDENDWFKTAVHGSPAPYTIARATITDMGATNVEFEENFVVIGSKKWAKRNIGASSDTEYGDYFGWASTETIYSNITSASSNNIVFKATANGYPHVYSTFNWTVDNSDSWFSHPRHCTANTPTFSKYVNNSTYGTVDNKATLEAVDDVAFQRMGGGDDSDASWHMPDASDIMGLVAGCVSFVDGSYGGKFGMRFYKTDVSDDKGKCCYNSKWNKYTYNGGLSGSWTTSGVVAPSGSYDGEPDLFFPAAGYCDGLSRLHAGSKGFYWSRSRYSTAYSAYSLYFNSGAVDPSNLSHRSLGCAVRPVL